jgi:hypothetical protein
MPSKSPFLPVLSLMLLLPLGIHSAQAMDYTDDDNVAPPLPPPPTGHHLVHLKQADMPDAVADPFVADRTWRLTLGYGFTSEKISYDATATPSAPVASGYGPVSHSTSPSASAGSFRITTGPLWGVHPLSRGDQWGMIYGADLDLAFYNSASVNLPVTDADTAAGTSRNGLVFNSSVSAQTYALGPQIGVAYDFSPALSFEGLAVGHLGIMHMSYTSGENMVFGNAPVPSLFTNSIYEPYYDIGLRANLAYRLPGGWEYVGTLGYVYGASMKGKLSDAVRFYQGVGPTALGPQAGTFEEQLKVQVSGPYLAIGLGRSF